MNQEFALKLHQDFARLYMQIQLERTGAPTKYDVAKSKCVARALGSAPFGKKECITPQHSPLARGALKKSANLHRQSLCSALSGWFV